MERGALGSGNRFRIRSADEVVADILSASRISFAVVARGAGGQSGEVDQLPECPLGGVRWLRMLKFRGGAGNEADF
jgi:hypothetical protein